MLFKVEFVRHAFSQQSYNVRQNNVARPNKTGTYCLVRLNFVKY